jgi:putative acetyltransferase
VWHCDASKIVDDPVPVLVRRYDSADREAVRRIHAEAFRRPDDPSATPVEVGLVEALTDSGDAVPALSLVAVRDGVAVGHVVCSKAWVGDHPAVGLGPIGVLPEHQRQGVGDALMHAVLAAADALEVPLVGLLGSTEYYPRYGFVPAARLGIESPNPAWGDHFQVRTLTAYGPDIVGRFRYAPPFEAL